MWQRCMPRHSKAREDGATRFCMGAAWREVRDGKEFDARARNGPPRRVAWAWKSAARWAC